MRHVWVFVVVKFYHLSANKKSIFENFFIIYIQTLSKYWLLFHQGDFNINYKKKKKKPINLDSIWNSFLFLKFQKLIGD